MVRPTNDSEGSQLELRLLSFLDREEHDEQRTLDELRALSIEERVLEGECLEGVEFVEQSGGRLRFRLIDDVSRFREGDAVAVGDGLRFEEASPLVYQGFDPDQRMLSLEIDRYSRCSPSFEPGEMYVVDRRGLGLRGRMHDIVRAGFADPKLAALLNGETEPEFDEARMERARASLAEFGLNEGQIEAGARAIGTEDAALIQGPPGTGKTRLLVSVLALLGRAGCRIALCAPTHRALDHALVTLRKLAPDLPVCKFGNPGKDSAALRRAGVRLQGGRPRDLPKQGIVAGTAYAFARLPSEERFHYTAFDEAGQLPIPHALAGMLCSRRWMFFGDHQQLPPVVTAEHSDRVASCSIFEHLEPSRGAVMLEETFRMNDGVCRVIGELFYGAALRPAEGVGERRLELDSPVEGPLAEVLDPDASVVIARSDHLNAGQRSPSEARLCAELIHTLHQHTEVPMREIAVVAPFRAQVRAIRSELARRGLEHPELVVDTVERIQGQEREVVIVSLAVGDEARLQRRSAFFFSPNRLNVALSRARSKAILITSGAVFTALPQDTESLRAACLFKRMAASLPQVDLTDAFTANSSREVG